LESIFASPPRLECYAP